MKKFLKITGIVFILLIALIVAIPFMFKDKIKQLVIEQINDNLNAKVDFGEFDLTIFKSFPSLYAELNDVKVTGINEFDGIELLNLKALDLGIDIMSVFGDEIKVHSVVLNRPDINVVVLPDGKANWDIVKPSADSTATDTTPSEPTTFKLNLKEFKIINANISYDDKSLKMLSEIRNLNFSLTGDMTQDYTTLETSTEVDSLTLVYDGVKYLNKTHLKFLADLEADLKNAKYTFKENSINLNELELGFDGFIEMPTDDIKMDIMFNAKKTEFKNILSLVPAVYMKDFSSVKTSGKLALNGFVKGTYNETTMPGYEVNLQVENAMFKYPSLPKSAENINIDVNVSDKDGVTDNTIVNIKKFHIDLANNPFDLKMLVTTPVSDAHIDGELKGKIDFSTIKDVVPVEGMDFQGVVTADVVMKGNMSTIEQEKYEEFDAHGNVDLTGFSFKSTDLPQGMTIANASLLFSPKELELKSFDSKIGKSDVKLTGNISNYMAYTFRDEMLKGNFTLNSAVLDVNEFMGGETTETTEETQPAAESELTVYEVPENIDFALASTIGTVYYDNLVLKNTSGTILIKDGAVDMNNLKTSLLDGNLTLNGKYDTKDIMKPNVDFNMVMEGFDIQKSFKAFNTVQKLVPVAEHCSGKFSTAMSFTTLLDQHMMPVMASINSAGTLKTKSMVISNSNMFNKLADELKMQQYKKLNLQDISLKFTIKDGKINVEPFDMKYSKTAAQLGGFMDLDQKLNFAMTLKIPRSEFGSDANQMLNGLVSQANSKGLNIQPGENVEIDAEITGTATDPKIKLNLKDQAKNLFDDLKNQALDEAKKKAQEEADKLKQQAQAEADRLKKEAEQKTKEAQAKAKAEADRLKKKAEEEAAKKKKEAEEKAKEEAKKKLNGILNH